MDTYRQLGFGANAVLREGVEIFEVNENGEVRRVEAASIDYIQIH
jgi:hypothetical protein